jgi:hypothetical protein
VGTGMAQFAIPGQSLQQMTVIHDFDTSVYAAEMLEIHFMMLRDFQLSLNVTLSDIRLSSAIPLSVVHKQ